MADEVAGARTPPAAAEPPERTRIGTPSRAKERARVAWTHSSSGFLPYEETTRAAPTARTSGGSLATRLRNAGAAAPPGGKDTTLEIGEVLGNTYRIESFLARGGMGAVYRARHLILDTEHAVKVIVPELADDPQILAMMKTEATALKKVRNDAVVQYEGLFLDEHGRRYLVMEYVDGPSLAHVLRDRALDPGEVRVLRDRLALGLAATHDGGVLHRDVSPDNVILPEGRIGNAKLIDFGIARDAELEAAAAGEEDFAGKYSYVSPEQAGMFGGRMDGRSDMYSLGLVLAASALGHGRKLDMGNSPATVIERRRAVPDLAEVPAELRDELAVLLQPNPEDRPPSLRDVVPGAREGEVVTIIRERATRGLVLGGAAAVLALFLTLGGLFFGFPALFRPLLADDPAVVEAQVRDAIGELRCSAIDVEVGSDRFFRNTVRVSGIVPAESDVLRIGNDLGRLRRLAAHELALEVIEWPFCEAVRTVRMAAAPASPETAPRIAAASPDFVFKDGEALVFDVTAPVEGYLYVAYLTSGNDLIEMLPTPRRTGNRVDANDTVRIGSRPGEHRNDAMYLVEPPFGRHLLLVTLSERPLLDVPKSAVTTSADYLDRLRSAIDRAVAEGASRPAMTHQFIATVAK